MSDIERRPLLQLLAMGWLPAACATQQPRSGPTLAELGILSAGQGSAFLPYAQGLAVLLSANGLKTRAIESRGSIENLQRVDVEPGIIGLAFLGTAYEGVSGTGSWTQGKRLDRVRALFPMYETSFQLVALRRSGVSALAQVAGKRVGVGPAGGPAESFFKGLLETASLQATLANGSPAALADELKAGSINVLWQGAAVPIPAIKLVADSSDALVFGLSQTEQRAMLARYPFLAPALVKADTYKGQDRPLISVAAWNFVVAHESLPDADAYFITKSALGLADPKTIHASAGPTRAENARNNAVVRFHPGALRYYKERGVAEAAWPS